MERIKIERLAYGAGTKMTKEEKHQRKKELQKVWRKNHPEYVKSSNKHYSMLYQKTKPFTSICCKCGKTFASARKGAKKYCDECRQKIRNRLAEEEKAILQRREQRFSEYREIIKLHQQGLPQTEIAEKVNRSQSGVSAILRKHLLVVKHVKKRVLKNK